MHRGWCHAMQAGMHTRHAVLARATSNPDQNRPCKPNTEIIFCVSVPGIQEPIVIAYELLART